MTDTHTTTHPLAVDHAAAEELAASLEELAALIRHRPAIARRSVGKLSLTLVGLSGPDFADCVALIGAGEKGENGAGQLELTRRFGQHVELCAIASKSDTCERIVVGTQKVKREVYPDDVKPTIETVEEEIIEWRCPPSFLALADSVAD